MYFFIASFTFSCVLGKKNYEDLMKKTRDIKINEEKLGKKTLSYDGYLEPLFPLDKTEDRTVSGKDINKDGVRDDIEIWINRNAETVEIRKALKDYYRKTLSIYEVIEDGRDEDEYKKSFDAREISGICLLQASFTQNKKYIKEHNVDAGIVFSRWIDILFRDNDYRKNIFKKEDGYNIKGILHYNDKDVVENCEIVIGSEQYAKVRKLAKDYAKSER